MVKISVRRFDDHPHQHQGCIKPEDERWMLVLDKAGDPHLFVRAQLGDGATGWLDVDTQMRDGLTIRDMIDVEAGPDCSAEMTEAEIEAALAGMFCPGPS